MSTREKWGLFGGSFNPVHLGHVRSVLQVAEKLSLDHVKIIPNSQNPLKTHVDGPRAEDRLEMVRLAFAPQRDWIDADDLEIVRGGASYTSETLRFMAKQKQNVDFFLILGSDVFLELDQWHEPHVLLQEANIVVMNRPGSFLPEDLSEMPEVVRTFATDEGWRDNELDLTSGRKIYFVEIDELAISAKEIRRRLRQGDYEDLKPVLPQSVLDYIQAQNLYAPYSSKIADFDGFTREVAGYLNDKKAIDIKAFDLRELDMPTEFTLVASGTSTRHASALGEEVVRKVKEKYNLFPQSVEGLNEGRWVLVDYGSLIVHVFYDFLRQEYKLEEIWKNGKNLPVNF